MLPPVDKFEMNRMAHARAQELHLPGSPAGQSGHSQLAWSARNNFGVKSWSQLDASQMKAIYDFLDANKRVPIKGELPK